MRWPSLMAVARGKPNGNLAYCRDDGQILPLIIGYVLLILTLVIVVVDITAVHLQRDRLFAVADGAALDAADALDTPRFYGTGTLTQPAAPRGEASPTLQSGLAVPLTDATVRDSALRYLKVAGPGSRLTSLAVDQPTGSPDGVTAQVTLVAQAELPLFSFAVARWSEGVPLRATSRARAIAQP